MTKGGWPAPNLSEYAPCVFAVYSFLLRFKRTVAKVVKIFHYRARCRLFPSRGRFWGSRTEKLPARCVPGGRGRRGEEGGAALPAFGAWRGEGRGNLGRGGAGRLFRRPGRGACADRGPPRRDAQSDETVARSAESGRHGNKTSGRRCLRTRLVHRWERRSGAMGDGAGRPAEIVARIPIKRGARPVEVWRARR